MPNNSAGLKLGVDGEKEFRNALTAINRELKVSASEMTMLAAKYDAENKSVTALTEKQSALEDQLKKQKDAVDVIKEALDNAEKSFGENDSRTLKWKESLNKAQAEVYKTERAIADNSKKLEENTDDLSDQAEALDDSADSEKDLGKEAENAGGKLDKLGAAGKAVGGAIATGLAAALAAAVAVTAAIGSGVKKMAEYTTEAASYADEIVTSSIVTGVSAEKLQELSYAADLVDVSVETITGSITKNISSMRKAADGSADMIEAYDKLGISVQNADGSLRDSETVFWEIVDALGGIDNETERDALAMQLLGKSAQDLNPLIAAGSERMEELADKAHEVGYVLDDETLSAFGAFDDNIQYLENGAQAAKNAIGTVLLPILTDLSGEGVDLLSEFTNGILSADGDIDKIVENLGGLIPEAISKVSSYLPKVMQMGGQVLGALTSELTKQVPTVAKMAGDIASQLITGITSYLPDFARSGVLIISELLTAVNDSLPMLAEAAIMTVETLANSLGTDILPVLIPSVVSSVLLVGQILIDNLDVLLGAALTVVEGVADGLLDSLPIILDRLPQLLSGVVVFIEQSVPMIEEAGVTLLSALGDNAPAILDALAHVWPELISGICIGLMEHYPELTQGATDLFMALVEVIPDIASAYLLAIPEFFDAIGQSLNDALPEIKRLAYENSEKIVQIFLDTVHSAKDWGKDLLDNFISGIKSKFGDLKNTVKSAAQTVRDFLGFSEPKEGPLSDFHTYSPDMIDLFVKGIKDNLWKMEDAFGLMSLPEISVPSLAGETSPYINGFAGAGSGTTVVNNYYVSDPSPEYHDAVMRDVNDYFGGGVYA